MNNSNETFFENSKKQTLSTWDQWVSLTLSLFVAVELFAQSNELWKYWQSRCSGGVELLDIWAVTHMDLEPPEIRATVNSVGLEQWATQMLWVRFKQWADIRQRKLGLRALPNSVALHCFHLLPFWTTFFIYWKNNTFSYLSYSVFLWPTFVSWNASWKVDVQIMWKTHPSNVSLPSTWSKMTLGSSTLLPLLNCC